MNPIDREKFGGFVAKRRRELGLTQQELADRLFLSNKAVSKWETGQSLPDITLLQPLAECLQVSVAELLRGEQVEDVPLEAEEAKTLVEQAIGLADRKPRTARWRLGWALSALLGTLETLALVWVGYSWAELSSNVLVVEFLCLILGLWAVFFAPERLPGYYDENRITAFQQGPVRLNLGGVRIHNGNWPHILTALRWWLVVTPAVFPAAYGGLRAVVVSWSLPWELGVTLTACLCLFVPVMVLAKKYE